MCIESPVPFHSDKPITAYKVMYCYGDIFLPCSNGVVYSKVAGNKYELGCTYQATNPIQFMNVSFCEEYDVGFHAYAKLEDAEKELVQEVFRQGFYIHSPYRVIEVELSEITHKGIERIEDDYCAVVYVAKQCTFVKIVESPFSLR